MARDHDSLTDAETVLGRSVSVEPPQDPATTLEPRDWPRLVARDACGAEYELPLQKRDTMVGRSTACDIVLSNPEVSRQHVRIVQFGEQCRLKVVGTRENTFVNGHRVVDECLLHHGDVIELASERLTFAEHAHSPASPADAVAATGSPSMRGVLAMVAGAAAFGLLGYVLLVGQRFASGSRSEPATVDAGAAAQREAPSRDDQVRRLLYQGDVALAEKRYTTPTDASAVWAYLEVLRLDSGNERAKTKLDTIIDHYLGLAEEAAGRKDATAACMYADTARLVHEQAPGVGDAASIERRIRAADPDHR